MRDTTDRKKPEPKICESCGAELLCRTNVGKCRCFAVGLKAETLAELCEDYRNCLLAKG